MRGYGDTTAPNDIDKYMITDLTGDVVGVEYCRLFFQEPGTAEADLERDVRRSMLGVLYTLSGDSVANGDLNEPHDGHFPTGMTFSEPFLIPDELPPWLTQADLQFYVDQITRTGFRGGLNWYRNINRLPGCLAPWAGATLNQPSLYLGGSTDLIAGNTPEAIEAMRESCFGRVRWAWLLLGCGIV